MQKNRLQQDFKEAEHDHQDLVAELRLENKCLMEVSCDAALLKLVELCYGHASVVTRQ
jgi:hypothetical protein